MANRRNASTKQYYDGFHGFLGFYIGKIFGVISRSNAENKPAKTDLKPGGNRIIWNITIMDFYTLEGSFT